MTQPTLVQSSTELETVFEHSRRHPVMLFKHSLACSVSAGAHHEYLKFLEEQNDGNFFLVEIQNEREVSDAVEARTGVRHESPQVLLLKDGEVVWHASHFEISRKSLAKALASVG